MNMHRLDAGKQFRRFSLHVKLNRDKAPSKAKQSKAKQSKAKQSKAKQSKAKQSKVKQSKAKQSKAKQSKVKQSKAKQSKAKQSKAKQSKAKQRKAKQSKEPHLSYRPTIQKIYTISTKAETTQNITDVKRPVVQKQTKNQVIIDGCRHNLPITKRLNTQQDDSREAMLSAKHTSQEYYNSHAKEREQLSELQHVWYKKDPVAHWQRGSVVQVADTPKSYVVQDDSGARYQRNSRHVRSATVLTDSEDPSDATPQV
ncbi:hypothetical protein CAPTEDRAFT_214243 [Capitella teleta]|uniref:Uncharacterized protein n=1 Tax=Capitella teleta TaxID=283909 RepID=R7VD20_CAPTE|nr:hypothetical protein CAPTEDRAFT_214243 [Capitella teleta]|eukprot:ELU16472.1 hypothetical protein CAPTEDRAFT_214243 [Capitella teleta]